MQHAIGTAGRGAQGSHLARQVQCPCPAWPLGLPAQHQQPLPPSSHTGQGWAAGTTHHSPGPTQCCPDSTPLNDRTSGWAVSSPRATPSPVGSLGSQDQHWSLLAFPSSPAHFIPRSGRCSPPALKQSVTLGQQQLIPLLLEGKHPVVPRWMRHPSLGWVKNDGEHGAQV